MKFTVATLVLASVAYSQTIASETAMLPSCSLTCLQNAITSAGCSMTDYTCQCGAQKNAITTAATPCIIGACTTNDALKVQSITSEICTLAAAQPASSGSSTATSAQSSLTSAASASTTGSSASSAISSASSSVASSISHASSSATSAASSSASSASRASSSAAAATTTNAASKKQAVGVVGAAAMLAAFAL